MLAQEFAVEVTDCNLATVLDAADKERLRQLLWDNSVLVFRNQQINLDQQVAFTSTFGPVDVPWDRHHKHPQDERIQIINNAGREKVDYKTTTLYWHSDQSFTRIPTSVTILYSTAAPTSGGRTLFANTRLAYANLPDTVRQQLGSLKARHSFGYVMMPLMKRRISEAAAIADGQRFPDVLHPLVRTHPITAQKALYLNELCVSGIEGVGEDASKRLLEQLYTFCLQPRFIYAHKWAVGDVVVWDNASLMHRAEDIPTQEQRIFYRTNTVGVAPE
jgi:taurine dioxygenase